MKVATSRRRDIWIALVLALVAVLFWRLRIIRPAYEITFGASDDPFTQIYPMMYRAALWEKAGRLPLWNPYQFAGHPFLASVLYGVFYPPNVLCLLMPIQYAMEASSVLHLFLAGLFTYAYLRELRVGRLAAFGGALTYPLTGFYASQALWFMPAWGAAVWLPLGLLAIERIFASRALGSACLLAVVVAMPVLAGWLQTFVYTMYCLGAYLGVRAIVALADRDERRRALLAAALATAALILGVGLAAVQLLPSAELQSLGPRHAGGLSVDQSIASAVLPPQRLLANAVDPRPGLPIPHWTYAGEVWLLLVPITAFAARQRWRVCFFWGVAIFSVLVALTTQTPVFALYRLLPASGWFRYPDRILFLYSFAVALLVAFALDVIARAAPRARSAIAMAILATIAAAAWGWFAHTALAGVYLATGAAAVWTIALATRAPIRRGALVLLVVAQGMSLFFATRNPALHPYQDASIYDREHEVFDVIAQTQEFWRTYIYYPATRDPGFMPKQGTLRGIYSITDYEPLSLERAGRYYRAMERPVPGERYPFIGIVNADPTLPIAERLLDMLSVRFAVVPRVAGPYHGALRARGWTVTLESGSQPTTLYTNPNALPRAYVVSDAKMARSEDEAFAAITAPNFDPRTSVVLEPADGDLANTEQGVAGANFPGATIERYEPDRVTIHVSHPQPGWLVLTDTWYPGWTATIDGKAAPIERANYLFRAVRVSGPSDVTFVFRPRSFAVGALVSAAALAVVGGLAIVSSYRRRA